MRAVLSWSYRTLTPAGACVFRLFGLHPRSTISAEALASLAGTTVREVRAQVTDLVRAHLLTVDDGRYASHDLLHEYAAELAGADPEARHRLLDHYLHSALIAVDVLETGRDPIDLPPGVTIPSFAGREQALAWFDAEHHSLTAVLENARSTGAHEHSWRLGLAIAGYLDNRGRWHDWITSMRSVIEAATALGHRPVQARAQRNLARAYAQIGSFLDARNHYEQALQLYGELADLGGQASTHFSMSWMADLEGDAARSLHHASRCLALYETAGHRLGQGRALNLVGWRHALGGETTKTLEYCRAALALQQELGDEDGQAATWDTIGYAHHRLGDHDEAIRCFRTSLELYRRCGDRYNEASVLDHLGDAQRGTDEPAARLSWRRAAAILRELGHPEADDVAAQLT